MCRGAGGGFYQQRDRLKIKTFNLRLSFSRNKNYGKQLPDSLTLLYLPRISGTPLEINNEKINSNSSAFVTLHRLVSPKNQVVFASMERVRVGEGVRFEVYLKEEKMLKGVFRKDDDHQNWKLDCKCELEEGNGLGSRPIGVKEAEVSVVSEGGHVEIEERVEMVVVKRRRCRGLLLLEEIPEEREEFDYEEEMDGCDCCECCGDMMEESGSEGSDGGDCEEGEEIEDMEMEMEGVRWAVDVGIWVMCLGVGYLVSKASTKSLRQKRFL